MEYFGYILLALAILLLMVLIHEAGHYTMAKILGFTVEEFSIGFGPKIFSRRRRNGELFSLRALPLGGFCAFLGETDETESDRAAEEERQRKKQAKKDKKKNKNAANEVADTATITPDAEKREPDVLAEPTANADDDLLSFVMKSKLEEEKAEEQSAAPESEPKPVRLDKYGNPAKTFNEQPPWKRIIVLLGGVLFNFLSAFVFSLIFIWAVGYSQPVVAERYADPSGVYYNADFRDGDTILSVNGKKIGVMNSFDELVKKYGDEAVTLEVLRDGEVTEITAERKSIETVDENGDPYTYTGFGIKTKYVQAGNNAGNAFTYCVPYTFKLSWSILGSFGDIFTGKEPITSMTGPIGSINAMAQLSQTNWRNILILLPLLASNLAIFNILPFPALDGAHIVFTIIEWIRKKPINRKVEGMIHSIGLIVLLAFVLIVDILHFVL